MSDPAGAGTEFETSVFVSCPFDAAYRPMFEVIVFAVFDCGYRPRYALGAYDAGEVRIEEIVALVRTCRLGVYDGTVNLAAGRLAGCG